MTTLEKLQKADKTNMVTKKDGTLSKRTIDGLKSFNNLPSEYKFYPTYTSGSGRFTTNQTNTNIYLLIKLLGYKMTKGNDTPKGGKTGDFIQVSKKAYNNLMSLVK